MQRSSLRQRAFLCSSFLKRWATFFAFGALLFTSVSAHSKCEISSTSSQSFQNNDAWAYFLTQASSCPTSVAEIRAEMQRFSVNEQNFVVNRRGQFDLVTGDYQVTTSLIGQFAGFPFSFGPGQLFITYPLRKVGDTIATYRAGLVPKFEIIAQAIAWDYTKNAFNFYQLNSANIPFQNGKWFYHGDSFDSLNDTSMIYRPPNPRTFGRSNSCTACHLSGGPIMKEVSAPYSNWWTLQRPFLFGNNKVSPEVTEAMKRLVDANVLAKNVRLGQEYLYKSPTYTTQLRTRSLQELLRPLFCTMEYELASDLSVLDANPGTVKVPSTFLVDPRFLSADMYMPVAFYLNGLAQLGAQWPKFSRRDGDRAFIVPVKSGADQQLIQRLIETGAVTNEFVLDVLALDMTNPSYSPRRCSLLTLVPNIASSNWFEIFVQNLRSTPWNHSQELYLNFTDSSRTIKYHQNRAKNFIEACRQKWAQPRGAFEAVLRMSQTRVGAADAQSSRHPLGFIYDEANRTLFPNIPLLVHQKFYSYSDSCELVDQGIWIRK